MTRAEDELDKFGKRILAPLRDAPSMDSPTVAQEKSRFLSKAEEIRLELTSRFTATQQGRRWNVISFFQLRPTGALVKAMVATLIVLVILIGSSFTVYAAQSSLPGEPLYTVKAWSEDIRLSMTTTTQGKLDLILTYTSRRADEINQLAEIGKTLPEQTSVRYQGELDSVLLLAAEMNDDQMQNALGKIKRQAEKQGMTLEELITILPPQAEPAIVHLQERLQEQINLSTFGEEDPQAFRLQVRARQHGHPGTSKKTPESSSSTLPTTKGSGTLIPGNDVNDNGKPKTTQVPGHGNQGSGEGNPSQGNGKHEPKTTP